MDMMPHQKTDINNMGPFSTDMIGVNYDYPDADPQTRKKIWSLHEQYTKGLLYFIGHDERVPFELRTQMLAWGYPKDEYQDNGNWTSQLYIREARRMIGSYVMTQANCQGKEMVKDGIGTAAYTMDSHNCERLIVNGMVKNEGNVEVGGFDPYPIAYKSIVPKLSECSNLIVPVCLSASHIAYGSISMEPVFMVLAQSAAVAAKIAIDNHQAVQMINVSKLKNKLKNNPLMDGSPPAMIIDNDDSLNVVRMGTWQKETQGGYGTSFYIDTSKSLAPKSLRFEPKLSISDKNNIYCYYPKIRKDVVLQLTLNTGKTTKDITITKASLPANIKSSGGWVALGVYFLSKNAKSFVQLASPGNQNISIADAIMLIRCPHKNNNRSKY